MAEETTKNKVLVFVGGVAAGAFLAWVFGGGQLRPRISSIKDRLSTVSSGTRGGGAREGHDNYRYGRRTEQEQMSDQYLDRFR